MRPIEIILLALVAVLALIDGRRPAWRRSAAVAVIAALGLHVWLEGVRWQMAPAYLTAIFVVGWRVAVDGRPTRPIARVGGRLLTLILLAASLAAGAVFPIPVLPELTGPYAIGTDIVYLRDGSRTDPYAPDGGAPARELMVQVWYPAVATANAAPAPYLTHPAAAAAALGDFLGLPPLILSHLNLITSHALIDAAPDRGDGPYPLILFSHGWSGFRTQSSFLLEELASQGYVVAAMDHTYAAAFTVLPDDRVAPLNPDALEGDGSDVPAARNRLVRQWAADLSFVLDTLPTLDALTAAPIDLNRVGVMGHSTGGGAAVEFCATDDRCTALMGLDTWAVPTSDAVIDAGLKQPHFLLYSELWPTPTNAARGVALLANSEAPGAVATIIGTDHYDFANIPFLTPLAAQLGLKGPLDGRRVVEIINHYVGGFFAETLQGEPGAWPMTPSAAFPEVEFDVIYENES